MIFRNVSWALVGASLACGGMARGEGGATKADTNSFQNLLRQAAEQDRLVRRTNDAAESTFQFDSKLSFEQVEGLFLQGSLSARQFQFYINNMRSAEHAKSGKSEAIHEQAIAVLREFKPDPAKNPKPGPALSPEQLPLLQPEEPPAAQPPDPLLEGFEEIEAKMEELLRLKQAREQTAPNPAQESPAQSANKTKRERLDDLLRQYIAGKLSEAEYNQRRSQVILEPEAK